VNPGQYLNPGDKIVTLQELDSIYVDFYLPQQELSRVASGQAVVAVTDTYPDKKFNGRISAISPKVDPQTRNVQIEAIIAIRGMNYFRACMRQSRFKQANPIVI